MKIQNLLWVLLMIVTLVFSNGCANQETYSVKTAMTLNDGWTFKKQDDTRWLPANVPGTVHTDLLAAEKIPEPFYRDNERSLQWIDKEAWVYECNFTVDSTLLIRRQALLVFKGLDTYTTIVLNGKQILETDNMFREWEVRVESILQKGENTLEITFHSPVEKGLKKLNNLGYGLPAVNDQSENGGLGKKKVSVFTRKAPYHFGWDWGPRFVTSSLRVSGVPSNWYLPTLPVLKMYITGKTIFLQKKPQ